MKNRIIPQINNLMKNSYLLLLFATLLSISCKNGSDLEGKKKELEESKKEMAELRTKIATLEKEIQSQDTTQKSTGGTAVLVSAITIANKPFEHFVEIRGTVASRKNVQLSSPAGGRIDQVNVKEGEKVSKGQALVVLDADVMRNSINELKTQLELATISFEKQERLWNQKIGTEMQYLQAKNNKESLERKLQTANSQLDDMIIRAPFAGVVDMVSALVGEMASPGVPLVRIVNPDDTYLSVDVSERYIGKFTPGQPAEVYFGVQDKKVTTKVKSVGRVINPENRTFNVEVAIPQGTNVQPNQVAMVSLMDYSNPESIAVPTRLIQRDNKGQFVYTLEGAQGNSTAKRTYITTGTTYNSMTEVSEGLKAGDVIVNEGYREVTEGALVKISGKGDTAVARK